MAGPECQPIEPGDDDQFILAQLIDKARELRPVATGTGDLLLEQPLATCAMQPLALVRGFAPGSDVVSDGLPCWPAVEKAGCKHFPIVTGSGKRAAGWAPFRWVNTCLGNIKTSITGTYHHVSPKHAQSYLTSFAYRFNRRYQLDSIVERLAWAAVRTAPHPYRVVTADA